MFCGGATCAGPVLRIGPASAGGAVSGRGAGAVVTGRGAAGGAGCTTGVGRDTCGAAGGGATVVAPRVDGGLDGEATWAHASEGNSNRPQESNERFMAHPRGEGHQHATGWVCRP